MKKIKKDDVLYMLLIFVFVIAGFIAMCYRAEQVDKQKELPVATQSNSVNLF